MDILRQHVLFQRVTRISESMRKAKMRDCTKAEHKSFSYLWQCMGLHEFCARVRRILSFGWNIRVIIILSWMNIVRWGNLNKTAAQARVYYNQKYMLRCLEVAEMKVDPLDSD